MISDRTTAPEMRRALLINADGTSQECCFGTLLASSPRVQLMDGRIYGRLCEDGPVLVYVQEKP